MATIWGRFAKEGGPMLVGGVGLVGRWSGAKGGDYQRACLALEEAPIAEVRSGVLCFADEPGPGLVLLDPGKRLVIAGSLCGDGDLDEAGWVTLAESLAAKPMPAEVARFEIAGEIAVFPAACDAAGIGAKTWMRPFEPKEAAAALGTSQMAPLRWPDQAVPIGQLVRFGGRVACSYGEIHLGAYSAGHVLWLIKV